MTNQPQGTPKSLSEAIQVALGRAEINADPVVVEMVRRQIQDYVAQGFTKAILQLEDKNVSAELMTLFAKTVAKAA